MICKVLIWVPININLESLKLLIIEKAAQADSFSMDQENVEKMIQIKNTVYEREKI